MCYATKCYFFSLPTSAVLSYAEYKPMLIFFGLIDAVQRLLKVRMREREGGKGREGKEKGRRREGKGREGEEREGEGRRELGKGREGGERGGREEKEESISIQCFSSIEISWGQW